jgi:hypothetical protein
MQRVYAFARISQVFAKAVIERIGVIVGASNSGTIRVGNFTSKAGELMGCLASE